MAKVPTINELLLRLPPETLNRVCSEEHLLKLTEHFSEWINIATYLRLTRVEQKDIEFSWPPEPRARRIKMFRKWKENIGNKATYRFLIHSLYEAGRADLINDLCEIVDRSKFSSAEQPNDDPIVSEHEAANISGEMSDDLDTETQTESSQPQLLKTNQFLLPYSSPDPQPVKHSSQTSSSQPTSAQFSDHPIGSALTNTLPQSDPSSLPSEHISPPPIPSLPECIVKYADYLKLVYKRMSALPNPNWPPSVIKEPVKLALIERKSDQSFTGDEEESLNSDYVHGKIDNIVARKKEIDFVDVFRPEANENDIPLKILMDGAPGVGKTTLTRKACIDWANGEMLQEYQLVVLVPLREAKYRRANDITDLFQGDDLELKEEVVKQVRRTSGKNVLLIFDGFDELSTEQRMQDSLFLNIITGYCLLECTVTVLVTSRPYSSDSLQCLESVNRHIEVLGFTEKQIETCIMSNIADKLQAKNLVAKLQERLDVASLCYIPLNCAIVIHVYMKHNYTLPNTLTSLYSDFVMDTLKRHATVVLKEERIIKELKCLYNLTKLPKVLQKQLFALSKLAYHGMLEDKFVFDYIDLSKTLTSSEDEENVDSCYLGLMTCVKNFTSIEEQCHYQFLHLSMREFLAAHYASCTLSAKEQQKFFIKHLHTVRYRLMLLFLAGLTKLNIPSPKKVLCQEKLNVYTLRFAPWFLFLGHLIFESRNFNLFGQLFKSIVDPTLFFITYYKLTLFDCMILAHFLCSTNHSWKKFQILNCSLSCRSIDVFKDICSEYTRNTTTLEEVDLSENNPNLITKIASMPWLSRTRQLKLTQSIVNGWQWQSVAEGVDEAMGHEFERMLQANTTLKELDLHHSFINDTIAKGIAAGLTKNSALVKLNIDNNALSDSVIAEILSSANSHNTLCHLQLCGVQLSLTYNTWELQIMNKCGLPQIICALNQSSLNIRLPSVLNLSQTNITASRAVIMFQSLELNTSLKELNLSKNKQLAESDSEAVSHAIESQNASS